MTRTYSLLFAIAGMLVSTTAIAADPWADQVVAYDAGIGGAPGYNDPYTALGSPARIDNPASSWAGDVTPINAAYGTSQIVSLGKGGSLTLSFDDAVADDLRNPFGIDLLVFGNAFAAWDYTNSVAIGGVVSEGGIIELSDGGTLWTVISEFADDSFPTCGWKDWTTDWGKVGTQATDFTLPVDPSFSITAGLSVSDLQAMYNGSGGGVGIDIGVYGFNQITHIRISNPSDSLTSPEIDAVADVTPVPEPSTIVLIVAGGLAALAWRWRRK